MRKSFKCAVFMLVAFLIHSGSYAQDSSKVQAYYIHEDPVYPSMATEY